MEKMSKEQLIEWFIENYGSHPLFAQFISVEEIRQRLEENISDVTYNHEPGKMSGHYDDENRVVNIDIEKANGSQLVVHEILHALTYIYSKEGYQKCGLQISQYGDFEQEDIKTWIYLNSEEKGRVYKELGRGINEGVTDWLSEELTGIKNKGYSREKNTTRLLFEVAGRESILRKYLDKEYINQIQDDFTLENLFGKEVEERYQDKDVAEKIKEVIIKLMTLQDQYTLLLKICNGEVEKLSEENRKMFDVAHKELLETTNDFIQICLGNTNSISNKKEILKRALENSVFGYSLFPQNEKIKEAFEQVLASKEIDTDEKISFLKGIGDGDTLIKLNADQIIEDFLLHSEETSNIPINFRMYQCSQITKSCYRVERFCINEGIIEEADFSKADMIEDFLKSIEIWRIYAKSGKHINMSLDEIEYQRVGNHYELVAQTDDNQLEDLIAKTRYDVTRGDRIEEKIIFPEQNGEEIEYNSQGIETEQWGRIEEQVKRMNEVANNKYSSIEIVGNDVIMWYKVEDENGKRQNRRENYVIGEDGTLEVAQVGETRRLTDDKSRLDIQLMKETSKAGVTTSQMLQVVETMKAILKIKENQNEKSTEKGDD